MCYYLNHKTVVRRPFRHAHIPLFQCSCAVDILFTSTRLDFRTPVEWTYHSTRRTWKTECKTKANSLATNSRKQNKKKQAEEQHVVRRRKSREVSRAGTSASEVISIRNRSWGILNRNVSSKIVKMAEGRTFGGHALNRRWRFGHDACTTEPR